MYHYSDSDIRDTSISNGFWARMQHIVSDSMLPFQWKALNDLLPNAEPSHCVENFRIAAGDSHDEFYGCRFQDSDLGKWIEEASYVLMTSPNPKLEEQIDELIDLIGRAQQPDGYLNTYYTVKEPEGKWTNLMEGHELYCAGHLMEAACAYYEATGKDHFLKIMLRMAQHIDSQFGPEPEKRHGIPGHPEIELALVRMYQATGQDWLLRLAKFFVDTRGTKPDYFEWEQEQYHAHKYHVEATMVNPKYEQYHLPVREQTTLEGHAVRALYLLCGMTDVGAESQDPSLIQAAERLFDNATTRRMYVTGAVGSTYHGEAFTLDYDLPNDTGYGETCASVALIFLANRLCRIHPNSKYGDVIDRALYNTCLAGMNFDGNRFFYVNPLEVDPEKSQKDPEKNHVLPERPEWFGCACCPPNLARLLASIGRYIYLWDDQNVYLNLFIGSETTLPMRGKNHRFRLETGYPYSGDVHLWPAAGKYTLNIRIPGWCKEFTISLNGVPLKPLIKNGYAVLDREWLDGELLSLDMKLETRRVYSHPAVSEDAGKVAVCRGPIVYCAEQADNGKQLHRLFIPRDAVIHEEHRDDLRSEIIGLYMQGLRLTNSEETLYTDTPPHNEPFTIRMIPYYAWANRGPGEMRVWLNESENA